MTETFIERISNKALRLYDLYRISRQKNPLPLITPEEQRLADEFRERIRSTPTQDTQDNTPAQTAWNDNMRSLQKFSSENDPRDFLSWDIVAGTMFVKYAKYSRIEYQYLRTLPTWERWEKALIENIAGNPQRCPFDTTK